MRFPLIDQCDLPCVFERVLPGQLHPDGRRYLPVIVLRPTGTRGADQLTPPELRLGVVDRHHRVREGDLGRPGAARLVCALSAVRLQTPPYRLGLLPEPGADGLSVAPAVLAQVAAVAAWEEQRGQLPYEALYTELLLDIGIGTLGLRTSLTAASLAETIGAPRLTVGDWVELSRSRIDVLSFDSDAVASGKRDAN